MDAVRIEGEMLNFFRDGAEPGRGTIVYRDLTSEGGDTDAQSEIDGAVWSYAAEDPDRPGAIARFDEHYSARFFGGFHGLLLDQRRKQGAEYRERVRLYGDPCIGETLSPCPPGGD